MRLAPLIGASLAASCGLLLLLELVSGASPNGGEPSLRANFEVPSLLDFGAFKRLFGKHYGSLVEELNRKRHFVPRALRAWLTAIRYKFGRASSYKAVNEMSDFTEAEVEQMENRLLLETPLVLEEKELEQASELVRTKRNTATATAAAAAAPLEWLKIRQLTEAELAAGRERNPRFELDSKLAPEERSELPDELFVDHRQSGCFSEPRHQGKCGCCYAFAIVSIMEYQICKQTGKLGELSEQYLVDCGKGRYNDRLRGCNGGMVSAAGNFVHDFGLETLKRYPYKGVEGSCPYELKTDGASGEPAKEVAQVRMELGAAVHLHQDHWELALERGGPLMVHAAIYTGIIEYGGGIDQAAGCRPKPSHEMVLVGHGRQEGQHYWLIRNSYGLSWGELGYWRLAKEAAARCMGRYGEAFGTRDGLHFSGRARRARRSR